jgi:prepilin-type N-terminal cleavage/methylation domain-containing protein
MAHNKLAHKKKQGMTLLEILIAMLILVFVIVGFMKATTDFMLYLKASKINARAKELAEKLRSGILNLPQLSACFNPSIIGELQSNATGNQSFITFDRPDFYVKDCPNVNNCISQFGCLYCYTGEEIILSNQINCTVGYPIRVGYNAGKVIYKDNESGQEIEVGSAVGIKVYYIEPKTRREKEINVLVYKKYEE